MLNQQTGKQNIVVRETFVWLKNIFHLNVIQRDSCVENSVFLLYSLHKTYSSSNAIQNVNTLIKKKQESGFVHRPD